MAQNGNLSKRASDRLDSTRLCIACVKLEKSSSLTLFRSTFRASGTFRLLTLGAQLRGSLLNEISKAAVSIVFQRIRSAISDSAIQTESTARIELVNSSARTVRIEFSSDPDIAIVEILETSDRKVLPWRLKAGAIRVTSTTGSERPKRAIRTLGTRDLLNAGRS